MYIGCPVGENSHEKHKSHEIGHWCVRGCKSGFTTLCWAFVGL